MLGCCLFRSRLDDTDSSCYHAKPQVKKQKDDPPKARLAHKAMVINKLATHVPDLVLTRSNTTRLPHSQKFEGVLMFADISGFTALCERYSMSSRSGCGTDRLSRALNDYLGEIVENILGTEGDVLKFAGDAFLALWKVTRANMDHILTRVIKCGLRIQERCDNWDTEVGVKLRVKIALSIGPVRVTTVGNESCSHFVLSGPAVLEVNIAEKFALSGDVILSPKVWAYCPDHELIEHTFKADDKHLAVTAYHRRKPKSPGKGSKASSSLPGSQRQRAGTTKSALTEERFTGWRRLSTGAYLLQSQATSARLAGKKSTLTDPLYRSSSITETAVEQDARGRQRAAVFVSPTDDEKARLRKYIIKPVLQKIDDNMPLEYLSEMRQVSVVFINLVFASGADIDESDSLQETFNIIHESMLAFEGCLNKVFMFDKGCTFLAIFGLPGYKHEDDCARALKCSYRMIELLKATKNVIQASIGVTTGSSFCGVVGHVHRHEYTVIGRKVNMAARLMMHYPNKVSCDSETFHHSKQPRAFFNELPLREMKGVSDAGVLHEYIEREDRRLSSGFNALTVPEYEYPLLGRAKEMEIFLRELDLISQHRERGEHRRIIVFQGDPGIGKSRMLDAAITAALKDDYTVIPLALTLNDSGTPYYVVKLLIAMLLEMEDCASHVEREHALIEHVKDEKLREDLCLLNDLLVLKFPINPRCLHMNSEQQTNALHNLLVKIVNQSTSEQCVIFAIDDAHFIDNDSWHFLAHLAANSSAVLLLTMRPFSDIQPCQTAMGVLSNRNCYHIKLGPLAKDCMAALACQMMDVVQVPQELVRILQEKSHGIASWCEQLIREMFSSDKLQLVPHRSPEATRLTGQITPDQTALQKRRESSSSGYSGRLPRSRRASVDESGPTISVPAETLRRLQQLEQGIDDDEQGERGASVVCIVAPGVQLQDMEIPNSMKGIIVSRIDRMKPTQQLIVKCGSVLGMTFTRRMLEAILPNNTVWRKALLRRAVHELMLAGIFECASSFQGNFHSKIRSTHAVASHGHGYRITTRAECYCDGQDTELNVQSVITNCRNLRFVSALLQETLYEMLLMDQRKKLHRLSALYLESFAHRCDSCGGGDFLPGHVDQELVTDGDEGSEAGEKKTGEEENSTSQTALNVAGDSGSTGGTTNAGTTKTSTENEPSKSGNRASGVLQGFRSRNQSIVRPLLESEENGEKEVDEEEVAEEGGEKKGTPEEDASDGEDMNSDVAPVECRMGRRNTISLRKGSVDSTLSIISIDGKSEQNDKEVESSQHEASNERESLDLRECVCADILNSVLSQIVRHWRAAGNTAKTIYFMLEAGAAAVATGNNMQALSYLNEALSFIRELDEGNKPLSEDPKEPKDITIRDHERALIERMIGQAMFRMGRVDESMPHFHRALIILGNVQPASRSSTVFKLMAEAFCQFFHVAFPRRCRGNTSCDDWTRYNEQARCLSHIWHFHENNRDYTRALLAAVQQVNRAEAANDDICEVIRSYSNMMETCQAYRWRKLGRRYEKMAMQRCVSTPTEVGARELGVISHLYNVSTKTRLANGNVQGAIDTGYSALKIAEKLHDNEMAIQVLPMLVRALMVAGRFASAIEKLQKLEYAATEEEDVMGKGLYINGCIDLVMETGISLERHDTLIQFCRQAAGEPAFSINNMPRFHLIAALALWYARLGRFESSCEWLSSLEVVMPVNKSCFYSIQGLTKLAECHLVNYFNCLKNAYQNTRERSRSQAKEVLDRLKVEVQRFPVFLPRLLHLRAYYHVLQGNSRQARKLLTKCIKVCDRTGNLMEKRWAQQSWESWADPSGDTLKNQEGAWLARSTDAASRYSGGQASEVEVVKFLLPLPRQPTE
ncbi:adenylate cyclase type 10-like [Diadema antillarum]|uniref:adenylate cyclase type 10-like n=1 Tax=Diadema antillarum TaxID=105358 RepID=UPI003A85321D